AELHGRDAATGKDRIFVEYGSSAENKSWKFEFDSKSKLLVSLKQWGDSDSHKGLPIFDIRKIVYFEQLPDEILTCRIRARSLRLIRRFMTQTTA
ncbi:MAG: hypothetical protein ACYSWQ_20280, partial [Planctomycetota bacterium]